MSATQKKLWDEGVNAEMDFWDDWFKTKGSDWPEEYNFRTTPDSYLQDHLVRYLPSDKSMIDILDVGAGPLSILGKKIRNDNRQLRITCSDPLADKYMTLLRKHNIVTSVLNVKANAEQLSDHFAENYFDFIYMRNALDHSFDPLISVGEMIKVLNKNRFIVLEHETNEAENEKYEGLHQWNIIIEQGQFIIWNKSIQYNVSKHYKDQADISCWYIEEKKYELTNSAPSPAKSDRNMVNAGFNFITIRKK